MGADEQAHVGRNDRGLHMVGSIRGMYTISIGSFRSVVSRTFSATPAMVKGGTGPRPISTMRPSLPADRRFCRSRSFREETSGKSRADDDRTRNLHGLTGIQAHALDDARLHRLKVARRKEFEWNRRVAGMRGEHVLAAGQRGKARGRDSLHSWKPPDLIDDFLIDAYVLGRFLPGRLISTVSRRSDENPSWALDRMV